jgi:hypothetical protein
MFCSRAEFELVWAREAVTSATIMTTTESDLSGNKIRSLRRAAEQREGKYRERVVSVKLKLHVHKARGVEIAKRSAKP